MAQLVVTNNVICSSPEGPMTYTAIPASRSRQNYLQAFLQLGAGAPVPVSALARHLHVSPPSVTNMLARLADERLVTHGARGAASLTPDGERAALLVLRRHRILEAFLVRVLELDWSEVHEDAEELEHHVSDRVLDALDRYMSHPKEDPHGHPIPDSRGRVARRALARGARRRRPRAHDPLEAQRTGARGARAHAGSQRGRGRLHTGDRRAQGR